MVRGFWQELPDPPDRLDPGEVHHRLRAGAQQRQRAAARRGRVREQARGESGGGGGADQRELVPVADAEQPAVGRAEQQHRALVRA